MRWLRPLTVLLFLAVAGNAWAAAGSQVVLLHDVRIGGPVAGDVVAVGGDGTVDEVVQGLHRCGRGILGILPLGTGNDTAAGLGIPLRLESAVRVLLDGARRRADLMRVGDHVVLNAIGIGLLGDINQRAVGFKKVRGFLGYLLAATVSLFRFQTPRVELEADGTHYQGPMTILAVHGGPTTGGGFALAPDAEPFDGLLDPGIPEAAKPLAQSLVRPAPGLSPGREHRRA